MTELLIPELFTKIFSAVFVFGLLIAVHEFGHFIVAKWCGVGVLKFSIGIGPAIFRKRWGETVYQIGLLPLGGFVKMAGDLSDFGYAEPFDESKAKLETEEALKAKEPEEVDPIEQAILADRNRWFVEQGFWGKTAIVLAGPVFNFILAFSLVALCCVLYGQRKLNDVPLLGSILVGSPADLAGLKAGDLIKKVDGREIQTWTELSSLIRKSQGNPLSLELQRNSEVLTLSAQAKPKTLKVSPGAQHTDYYLGVNMGEDFSYRNLSVLESLEAASEWTVGYTVLTYQGLGQLFTGKSSLDELASPIYIAKTAAKHASKGLEDLLYLTALLSISLAVLNLLPIPVLDGGHLMFFIFEAIFGPISIRAREFAQQLGVYFLLLLMAIAIKNDFTRPSEEEKSKPQKWEAEKEVTAKP